jgi:hypothetical protein
MEFPDVAFTPTGYRSPSHLKNPKGHQETSQFRETAIPEPSGTTKKENPEL